MTFSSLEELYKVDPEKSEKGIEVPIGVNALGDDIIMIVAESGTKEHKKVQRKYERALEATRRNDKKRLVVMAKIIAESLLKNWKGVLDDDQKEVKYTVKRGIEALVKYERLSFEIIDASINRDNYRFDEETEKNLKPS